MQTVEVVQQPVVAEPTVLRQWTDEAGYTWRTWMTVRPTGGLALTGKSMDEQIADYLKRWGIHQEFTYQLAKANCGLRLADQAI